MSLPSPGAWIETRNLLTYADIPGRSLHRERGLKPDSHVMVDLRLRRSLHRERGLKRRHLSATPQQAKSLPSPGAWIETQINKGIEPTSPVAPFTGSVD